MLKDNPTLEDALDGLYHASHYLDSIGERELAREAGKLYQKAARASPEEHWDAQEMMDVDVIINKEAYQAMGEVEIPHEEDDWDMEAWDEVAEEKPSAQGAMERNPLNEEEKYE